MRGLIRMIRHETDASQANQFDIWDRFPKIRCNKIVKEKNKFFLMNPDFSLMELISEAHGDSINLFVAVDSHISYDTYNRIKNYVPYNGVDMLELFSIPEVPQGIDYSDMVIILSGFMIDENKVVILASDLEKLNFYSNFFDGDILLYLIKEEQIKVIPEKWVVLEKDKYFTNII
jgi:hypothetical protein